MVSKILLLGAGFSRNWGGWLASEAFEYLLGCKELDDPLRNLLWRHKERGFEAALADLQMSSPKGMKSQSLVKLETAILQMFADMERGFLDVGFEFVGRRGDQSVAGFLSRFDAIFTLNQDLLLERSYLNEHIGSHNPNWRGWQMPGMGRGSNPSNGHLEPHAGKWFVRNDCDIHAEENLQPYIKLHGSSNWFTGDSEELLVMGVDKISRINSHEILKWNYELFRKYMSETDVNLMVIGYSFGDSHINDVVREAALGGAMKLFVIDPMGVDVLDKNRGSKMAIYEVDKLARDVWPSIVGASRRTLREIFGHDRIEFGKVMRFFQ